MVLVKTVYWLFWNVDNQEKSALSLHNVLGYPIGPEFQFSTWFLRMWFVSRKGKEHTEIPDPPQGSWFPNAGLLKSPKRPFGKSSQLAALLSSPRPASPSVVEIVERPRVAVLVAFSGDINRVESILAARDGVPGGSLQKWANWHLSVEFEGDTYDNQLIFFQR